MNRRLLLTPIVILVLCAFIASPVSAAKNYVAEQYDVHGVVQPDGSLLFTETITFRFEGGPFTYVFRELAYRNLDAIEPVTASMDGRALPEGTQAGQVEIAKGRPLKVTWHFPPTSNSTHTFTLVYQVRGAIRHDSAADTLIWRAIPEEHDYSIQRSAITIEYPQGINPLSTPTLSRAGAQPEMSASAITFAVNEIDEDEAVDVTFQFPSGSLVDQSPAWQAAQAQRENRTRTALPYALAAAALAGVLGLATILGLSQGFRREEHAYYPAASGFSSPPRAIAPALVARLTGSSTPFLGTLFDLARRGFLRIEEGPKKWGSSAFEIVRQPDTGPLLPHEQEFIHSLFGKANSDRVDLSKIASLASDRQYNSALEEELTTLGWRDADRSQRRSRFLVWMTFGLLFGLLLMVSGLLWNGMPVSTDPLLASAPLVLIGAGAAWAIACLIGLFIAAFASTLTSEGIRQAADWNNFTGYLRNIARGREPVVSPDLFERYLPYAASLGIATEWGKFFQKMAGVPVPDWFQGLQPGLADGSFVAIMAAISSADSSASASSASGGASGGGASGAG